MTHERRTHTTHEARESAEVATSTRGAESAVDAPLDGAPLVVSRRPMGGRCRPRIASVIPAAPPPAPPPDGGGGGNAPASEPSSPQHGDTPSTGTTGEPTTSAARGTPSGASTRTCRKNLGGRGHRSPGRPPPAQLPLEGGGEGEGGAPASEPSSPSPAPSSEPSADETASASGTVRVTQRETHQRSGRGVPRRNAPSETRRAVTQQGRARARVERFAPRNAPGVTLCSSGAR